MNEQHLAAWPDHMQVVFALVGNLMAGGRLSPDLLDKLPDDDRSIIPDHRITIIHTAAAELRQRRGRYTVAITGSRIDGQWHLGSGQFERLARQAAVQLPDGP